jgi:hypothetical protein
LPKGVTPAGVFVPEQGDVVAKEQVIEKIDVGLCVGLDLRRNGRAICSQANAQCGEDLFSAFR